MSINANSLNNPTTSNANSASLIPSCANGLETHFQMKGSTVNTDSLSNQGGDLMVWTWLWKALKITW
ncbi:hypothetical protein Zmor_017778 [Zophobas morio]|uniref:Uncharacterized protein n=1 Tax=Zophobas morio TaxID=2755281 RepID=A0AA38IC38_9CUCU|nr:hypothetical protein Zmor_017778 [Zophobas morio]